MTVDDPHDHAGDEARPAPRASVLQTVKAVAASFFGVRGGRAHERDMHSLNLVVVIAVGIGLAAAFVVTLLLIVRGVVGT